MTRTFAALSDPTRRDFLERLSTGPASISELATPHISLRGALQALHAFRTLDDVSSSGARVAG